MDNQRIILFVALSLVLVLIWDAWQRDHTVQPVAESSVQSVAALPGGHDPADLNALPAAAEDDIPSVATPKSSFAAPLAADAPDMGQVLVDGESIRVVTDVLDVEINTIGGDIRSVSLLKYPVAASQPDDPYQLMRSSPPNLFVLQSGVLSREKTEAANHHSRFVAEQLKYQLGSDDTIEVRLSWKGESGISVEKIYTFQRGSYAINLKNQVTNGSGKEWQGREYRQLQRSRPEGRESFFIYTYTGGVIYDEERKYEKVDFDDMSEQDININTSNAWLAMIQHYFLGAVIPDKDAKVQLYSKSLGDERYALGVVSQMVAVAPEQTKTFTGRIYIGPKIQDHLESVAPGLELTVDYGFLTIISKPLFAILSWLHGVFNNWGWSIIVLTLLIKILFYKLSAASYRSMSRMRLLQPKMMEIRERYGEDRQRMSQATMELYKKEKVNPFGGCLPMLVQIPVFIALYWVLLESVELRQADFILWITDLSSKDPYYVLPLLMGTSMFIQQKLNPAPPDPMQAKIMMALPVIFTLFFAFFPAGLVLYWTVNNILSITQHWYVQKTLEKTLEKEKIKKANKGKKSK